MKKDELYNFICKRYPHWLEYSQYLCSERNIQNDAMDILDRVLCSIWEKGYKTNFTQMIRLINQKRKDETGLDYYVLNSIKRNTLSKNAPHWREWYKDSRFLIHDELFVPQNYIYNPFDPSEEQIRQQQLDLIDEAIRKLHFPPYKMLLFNFYHIEGKDLKDWDGPESLPTRYRILKNMVREIQEEIKKMKER